MQLNSGDKVQPGDGSPEILVDVNHNSRDDHNSTKTYTWVAPPQGADTSVA